MAMDGALSKSFLPALWLLILLTGSFLPAGCADTAASREPLLAQAATAPADSAAEQPSGEQPPGQEQPFEPSDGKQIPQAGPAAAAPEAPPNNDQARVAAPAAEPSGDQPPPQAGAAEEPAAPAMQADSESRREKMAAEPSTMGEAGTPGEWERGALENLFDSGSNAVRIAVLNASGKPRRAGMVAFFLEEHRKKSLEKKLGKRISVVNLSNLPGKSQRKSVIYYRPGNLRAALLMANAIPGKLTVEPMNDERPQKIGIDIEIRIGRETP